MEYHLIKVIAGETGLQARELALERIRGLLMAGSSHELDESSRREMEDLTGYDLSNARIHSSFPAGSLARSLGAEAFTIGRHIFTPPEKIDGAFNSGKGLLAHELTHVIQQTSPPRTTDTGSDARTGPDITANEGRAQLPLVQLARGAQGTAQAGSQRGELETEAERLEAAARETTRQRTQPSGMDWEMLADMVYRLMHDELQVHCDRRR